jgi:group II intron reverse transcriptase/maturase
MRKSGKHQKNTGQINMFNRRKPVQDNDGVSGEIPVTGDELQSLLERERALSANIMERITDHVNLNKAYHQVVSNHGSSGTDGMDIEDFKQWYGKGIEPMRKALLSETYKVSPVQKVEIPKVTGGTRVLGIPTVKDRFIQQAIHQELNKHYEPYFSESSYGFRPGRGAHQAIEQAAKYVMEGKQWVVDIDLENFFDKINHDRLMQRISKRISDKRLLRLIKAYLTAGMMEGGLVEQRISGTPQGGPLSPLLSNIVLDELDRELEIRGHSFCRYADDCNIYVKSRKAGERVLEKTVKYIEQKLKLKVNRLKSGVRHCSEVKFLGYTIMPEGKIRIADKSIDRFKDKVRMITKRNRGVKFEQVIKELNLLIRGWKKYFKLANTWLSNIRDIDGWIRRKIRCYRVKQCGRKYTIFKLLRSLKCLESMAWNAIMYSQGWWVLSRKNAVSQSMNPKWFAEQGLLSVHPL